MGRKKNVKWVKEFDRFAISPGVFIGRSNGYHKEKESLPLYGTWFGISLSVLIYFMVGFYFLYLIQQMDNGSGDNFIHNEVIN
jgi:hypothetical protein